MELERVLERGVAQVIVREELEEMLRSGRTLRIKYGVDPSRPDLHLGHVVCFRKLRQLQELGHKVVVIVGDWTARIGDPSGKLETRPMLTEEEVRRNAQTYLDQFFRVVDVGRAEIRWQSAWFDGFTLEDMIRLAARYTVAQMLARDDFAKRYAEGSPISVAEFLYPLLQAYDSVAIQADVELGGTDQTFNLLAGRDIQRQMGQPPQQILTVPLLVGTDGVQKMSKSLDNYIAIIDPPGEMYGKIMSLPDEQITSYFWLLTDVPEEELRQMEQDMAAHRVNPRDLKMRLARHIVSDFHSAQAAQEAEANFVRVFREREMPQLEALPVHNTSSRQLSRVVQEVTSGSASSAWRLIQQGGVYVDGQRIEDPHYVLPPTSGSVLRVGKQGFWRVVWKEPEEEEEG